MRPTSSSNSTNPRKRHYLSDSSSGEDSDDSESHVNGRQKLNKVKSSRDDSGNLQPRNNLVPLRHTAPSTSSNGHRRPPARNSRNSKPNRNMVPPRRPQPNNSTRTPASTSANLPPPQNAPPLLPKPFHEQLTTLQKLSAFHAIPLSGKKTVDEAFDWQKEKLEEFFNEKQFPSEEEADKFGKKIGMTGELVEDLLLEMRENTLIDYIRGKRASLPGQLKDLMSEYEKNKVWDTRLRQKLTKKLQLKMPQVLKFLEMVRKIKPVGRLTKRGLKLLMEQLEEMKHGRNPSAIKLNLIREETELSVPEIQEWLHEKLRAATEEETPDPPLDDLENGVRKIGGEVLADGREEAEQELGNGNGHGFDLDDEQQPPNHFQNYEEEANYEGIDGEQVRDNYDFGDHQLEHQIHDNGIQERVNYEGNGVREQEDYDQQMNHQLHEEREFQVQEPNGVRTDNGPYEVITLDDSDEDVKIEDGPNQEEQRLAERKREQLNAILLHWSKENPNPTFHQIQEIANTCNLDGNQVFQFLQDRAQGKRGSHH